MEKQQQTEQDEGGGGTEENLNQTSQQQQWQKDIWHHRYLPYFDQLRTEADAQLAAIKQGLPLAVVLREVRPGLLHWIGELDRYIDLHSRRFTKADHVAFVQLLFNCMLMKNLEYDLVRICANTLSTLLSKKRLLSRADLTLPWRPLFDLYVAVAYRNDDDLTLVPAGLSAALETAIDHTRTFFPIEATQELLDQLRPCMHPWDVTMNRALTLLHLFLPTRLSPSEHLEHGAALWLEELWHWYTAVENAPIWEMKIGLIFARLSLESPGVVDWRSRFDVICTRLLRSLNLQLGQQERVSAGSGVFSLNAAATWFCYMLGGDDDGIQRHLTRLFRSLESFFHPSNYGAHTASLLSFLHSLVQCVCQRLKRERRRQKLPDWRPMIPSRLHLTDRQVDLFVESVLPSALLVVFTQVKQDYAPAIIRFLGFLAPRLVLPAVLDIVYPALVTVTEPHRLLQSMACLVAVGVSLVRDDGSSDKEGEENDGKRRRLLDCEEESEGGRPYRSHVITLLNAVLPGIDANDVDKSAVTFQLIGQFFALVPIVDCSEAVSVREDLTDEERDLCLATANFEGIIDNLTTRVFSLIETLAHGQSMTTVQTSLTAKTPAKYSAEETKLNSGIFAVFRTLLGNCSTAIYEVTVQRLFAFIADNMFDSRVAADTVADLLFSATNPAVSLPLFLHHVLKGLRTTISEDTQKEEEVDSAVMWWLILAAQVVRVNGRQLVIFKAEILELLSLVLPLKCRQAHVLACLTLKHVLMMLTTVYADMHEANRRRLDQPLQDFLPTRHWAQSVDKATWQLHWHVPSAEELVLADEIFRRFLSPELLRLADPVPLTKEELLRSLSLVRAAVTGAAMALPFFESAVVALAPDSIVPRAAFTFMTAPSSVTALTIDDQHARGRVLSVMHALVDFFLTVRTDDTRALAAVCQLYADLIFERALFDPSFQGVSVSREFLVDAVRGQAANIELVAQESVVLEHQARYATAARAGFRFTESHLTVMRDLVRMGTSAYSVVRIDAQTALVACVHFLPHSYKLILDDVLKLLREDKAISHEQFKGALYILLNGQRQSLCVRPSWETLVNVWPALVLAQHSDKPSVIALLDLVPDVVIGYLDPFQIRFQFPDESVALAKKLLHDDLQDATAQKKWSLPTEDEERAAIEKEEARNAGNDRLYSSLIARLVALSTAPSLHWRHTAMAQSLLSLLIRRDRPFPSSAVRLFVQLLVHDKAKTRQTAAEVLGFWLWMVKPRAAKIPFTPPIQLANRGPGARWPIEYGFLSDNAFLQYSDETLPRTATDWDEMVFVDKDYWGCYTWPKTLKVCSPASEQLEANRPLEQLTPDERFIVDQFRDADFLACLVRFHTLEEDEGEDHFSWTSFRLIKGLFRLLSSHLLPVFRPLLARLVQSTREGDQRLAAEVVAGVVQGSRLWPYEQLAAMWQWLTPLVTVALTVKGLKEASSANWVTAVEVACTGRDPRRLHWMLDALFALAAHTPTDSSAHSANRLLLLQSALCQCEWRVMELWHRLADLCRPQFVQPYQNLRQRLGSCMANIVLFDISGISVDEAAVSIRQRPPSLDALVDEIASVNGKLNVLWMEAMGNKEEGEGTPMESERKEALLQLKTLLSYLDHHWGNCLVSLPASIVRLLPLLAHFENETSDEELKDGAHRQLQRWMAQALIADDAIADRLLDLCHEVLQCDGGGWKARVSLLKYLQVAVFSNLFLFLSATRRHFLRRLIDVSLADDRLEVREAAAESLAGFLHCAFFDVTSEEIAQYSSWSLSSSLRHRHAGVLALAAVVQAFPYSVPAFLPAVLMKLCPHASDKQPMQGTVMKALSEFKRTHQDSWHEHKQRFSSDQLAVLTDLLVSPNYYV